MPGYNPHQHPWFFLFVDVTAFAIRAAITGLHFRVNDLNLFSSAKRIRAIAAMPRRFTLALGLTTGRGKADMTHRPNRPGADTAVQTYAQAGIPQDVALKIMASLVRETTENL